MTLESQKIAVLEKLVIRLLPCLIHNLTMHDRIALEALLCELKGIKPEPRRGWVHVTAIYETLEEFNREVPLATPIYVQEIL